LTAALHRAGHRCVWFDCLTGADKLAQTVQGCRPDFAGISARNIDDVLIRKQETFYDALASLTEIIRRESQCPIILGGSGFSIFPAPLLELAGADFGIAGEGETALVQLIAALEGDRNYRSISGLVFREGDTIIVNPANETRSMDPQSALSFTHSTASAETHQEIADFEFPQNITAYYLQNGGILNVQTQRGCAHRCCYCTYPLIEGRRHRSRPAELVAAEFEELQRLGARYIFIVDSVFNSSPGHVTEICEALLRRNVQLPWGCFLRPQGLNRELVRLMARAGLSHVEFGSDSFCDDVLSAYQKGLTFADILEASELVEELGVDFCHFLIVGGPGETRETLSQSFENSRRIEGGVVMAVVGMRVYPGTELFKRACAEGQINPTTNLLAPAYYLSPGLDAGELFTQIRQFARQRPNWIIGDPDSTYQQLVARLRQRGIAGPLWSYFSMIQHIRPQELARSG
jgi:radical SAM superfamily enzyme YgiQ (UPF0313 family)